MRLNKPLEKFTKEEIKLNCGKIRKILSHKAEITVENCILNPIICHFRFSKFCPNNLHQEEIKKKVRGRNA